VVRDSTAGQKKKGTYIASSKFFSAMALLPRDLSSSAMVEGRFSGRFGEQILFVRVGNSQIFEK
jgi:hypothetical protein